MFRGFWAFRALMTFRAFRGSRAFRVQAFRCLGFLGLWLYEFRAYGFKPTSSCWELVASYSCSNSFRILSRTSPPSFTKNSEVSGLLGFSPLILTVLNRD